MGMLLHRHYPDNSKKKTEDKEQTVKSAPSPVVKTKKPGRPKKKG